MLFIRTPCSPRRLFVAAHQTGEKTMYKTWRKLLYEMPKSCALTSYTGVFYSSDSRSGRPLVDLALVQSTNARGGVDEWEREWKFIGIEREGFYDRREKGRSSSSVLDDYTARLPPDFIVPRSPDGVCTENVKSAPSKAIDSALFLSRDFFFMHRIRRSGKLAPLGRF